MDDELELNITVPVKRPNKPAVAARPVKDGGAKRHDDIAKPAARSSAKPGMNSQQHARSSPNGKIPPSQQRSGKAPNDHQPKVAGVGPAKQPHQAPKQLRTDNSRSGRVQQRPGKERFKRTADGGGLDPDDPDELLRADEPDDVQQEDLRAAMSLLAQREAALQQEEQAAAAVRGGKAARAPAAEREGVVEFDDDDGCGGGEWRKRRRLNGFADGGAAPAPATPAAPKATGRGNYIPGSLVHAGINAAAAANGATGNDRAGAADGDAAAAAANGSSEWSALGLAPSLSQRLCGLNFVSPTAIQRAVLPVLMSGRDALVRAQTGSGKTLSYLLPIINDLQAQQPRISRAEGTFALVLAPTRELCLQVYDVATAILQRYSWLVAGLLIGGENRNHEKARLRKGVALLAASPGRLLDHLASTASFRTSELRWLVLDEADRLLDLGFEAKLRQITELINRRSGAGAAAGAADKQQQQRRKGQQQLDPDLEEEGDGDEEGEAEEADDAGGGEQLGSSQRRVGRGGSAAGGGGDSSGGSSGRRRQTVLLSATLHKQLGALAELALKDPAVVGFEMRKTGTGLEFLAASGGARSGGGAAGGDVDDSLSQYSLPATLRQSWVEVPAKERLTVLAALLRSRVAWRRRVGGSKVVVFVASCDEVEFLSHLLGDMWEAAAGAALLPPAVRLFKLHGDMPQAQRTETFAGFSQEGDGVLLCTDVAARGLDFPNVTTIIQYDVPGTPSEYVHRVGRSARLGAAGEAVLMLMPHETPYVNLLRSRGVLLEQEPLDKLSRWMPAPPPDQVRPTKKRDSAAAAGGGGAARQLAQQLHRQVAAAVSRDPHAAKLANDAFRSFVRAYATHAADLKRVFAVRNLHLGHVAHSFCLLERPTTLGSSGSAADRKRRKREAVAAAAVDRRKKMKRAAHRVSA